MDGNFARGIGAALKAVWITLLFTVPLALWKLVEIVIWAAHHINIDWKP